MFNFKYFTTKDKIFLLLNSKMDFNEVKQLYEENILSSNSNKYMIFNYLLANYVQQGINSNTVFDTSNMSNYIKGLNNKTPSNGSFTNKLKQQKYKNIIQGLTKFNEEMKDIESILHKKDLFDLERIARQNGDNLEFGGAFAGVRGFDSVIWNGSEFLRNGSVIPPSKAERVIRIDLVKSYFDAFKYNNDVMSKASQELDKKIFYLLNTKTMPQNKEILDRDKMLKIYDAVVAYSIYDVLTNKNLQNIPGIRTNDIDREGSAEKYLKKLKTSQINKCSLEILKMSIDEKEKDGIIYVP